MLLKPTIVCLLIAQLTACGARGTSTSVGTKKKGGAIGSQTADTPSGNAPMAIVQLNVIGVMDQTLQGIVGQQVTWVFAAQTSRSIEVELRVMGLANGMQANRVGNGVVQVTWMPQMPTNGKLTVVARDLTHCQKTGANCSTFNGTVTTSDLSRDLHYLIQPPYQQNQPPYPGQFQQPTMNGFNNCTSSILNTTSSGLGNLGSGSFFSSLAGTFGSCLGTFM